MSGFIPPLTWFRAFESSARCLSFTKAADELNLTQSAISQHVRALEDSLGCQLFVRKHRGLVLTDQGRRLLPSVSTGISTLSAAAETFSSPTQNSILTVASSLSIAQCYIIPHLKSFTNAHPDVTVRLITGTWPDEFSNLDFDVEIRFDSHQSSNINATKILPNEMQIVGAPTVIAKRKSGVYAPQELAELPLIQVIGTADTWQDFFNDRGIETRAEPVALVESHGIAVELAKAGLGIAYTNAIIAAPSVRDNTLHILDRADKTPTDGYYISCKRISEAPLAEPFAQWLQGLIQHPI